MSEHQPNLLAVRTSRTQAVLRWIPVVVGLGFAMGAFFLWQTLTALVVGLLMALLMALTVYLGQTAQLRAWQAEEANRILADEISERKRVERELCQARDELESQVKKRNAELLNTIDELQLEILRRELAQIQLTNSKGQYRDLVDSLDGIVWEMDARDFRFTFVSKQCERMLGYTRERWLNELTWRDLIHPEDLDYVLTTCKKAVEQIRNCSIEYRAIAADGRVLWLSCNATVIVNDNQTVKLRGVSLDITERKQAEEQIRLLNEAQGQLEEQLRQSQKMEAIGQLAGGIAHDFNNLLTIITGQSDRLLKRLPPDDPLCQRIEEIRKAGLRAATLIRRLLAFSRKQVMKPRVLDLNSLVVDTNKMLQRLIGEDIELVTVPGPDLGPVKADSAQLEQVVLNLTLNARDAMPQGGLLTIETANVELDEAYAQRHVGVEPGRYVMLAVSDTGCGMDRETLSHIFEPFFTTKEVGKGTGLGLAMIHGIIKQSGGHIWVYSEPNQGSTFKIYLPRIEGSVKVAEPQSASAGQPPGVETILLVEDEDALRKMACEILKESGYTVLEASCGEEALQLCERHEGPIHLLLTDVVMPRMSGRELAERLKQLCPEAIVLYMSGHTENAIVHHGVLDPGTTLISKPFTPDELVAKVREMLDLS